MFISRTIRHLVIMIAFLFLLPTPFLFVFADFFTGSAIVPISEESPIIFHGKIEKTEYVTGASLKAPNVPYTIVTMEVLKAYRGITNEDTVTIYTYGGISGESFFDFYGQASFEPSDEFIIFYNSSLYPMTASVRGWSGLFRIVQEGSEKVILDGTWRPVLSLNLGHVSVVLNTYCIPQIDNHNICSLWESPSRQSSMSRSEIEGLAMDLEDFEVELETIIEENSEFINGGFSNEEEFLSEFRRFVE